MLRAAMTLAYKFEEIAARELKPSLYELDGISRATIEAHYKLYEGYVNKRNEILGRLDGVRLGRGPALQLRRRHAEHVPDLERDAARRPRRLRARLLPRLPDRPRLVHRRLLRQPRLVDHQRLGVEVPDPAVSDTLATVLCVGAGYLAGSIPTGYWIVRAWRGIDIRTVGSGNIGASNVWRVFGRRYGVPVVG